MIQFDGKYKFKPIREFDLNESEEITNLCNFRPDDDWKMFSRNWVSRKLMVLEMDS